MSEDLGSAEAGNPTAPAAAPQVNTWYATDGLDEGTASQLGELVKAKGWKGPADALLSYQNLEKVFGADKAGRTILAPKSEVEAYPAARLQVRKAPGLLVFHAAVRPLELESIAAADLGVTLGVGRKPARQAGL